MHDEPVVVEGFVSSSISVCTICNGPCELERLFKEAEEKQVAAFATLAEPNTGTPVEPDPDVNPKKAFGDAKVPLHLVPPALNVGAARAFNEGRKYGPYNWREKRVEAMTYIGAIKRHIDAYLDGEDIDPDSTVGKLHLEGIAASVGILLDCTYSGTLVDNRPPKGPAPVELRKLVPKVPDAK
jgi:hypothetical protein